MPNLTRRDVISSIRPALRAEPTTEQERAQFVSDLVREVYEFVKFDLHHPGADTVERARLGELVDAALPPIPPMPSSSERVAPVTVMRPSLEDSWFTTEPQLHTFDTGEGDGQSQERNTDHPSS